MKITGGCFCNAIRHAIDGDPIDVGYCHCSQCRKSSGAPLMARATFPGRCLAGTQGVPTVYAAPGCAHRPFCPACGTQPTFLHGPDATTIGATPGSLDDVPPVRPQYHIWWHDKVDRLQMDDDLPRQADAGPDGFPPPPESVSPC